LLLRWDDLFEEQDGDPFHDGIDVVFGTDEGIGLNSERLEISRTSQMLLHPRV